MGTEPQQETRIFIPFLRQPVQVVPQSRTTYCRDTAKKQDLLRRGKKLSAT
ncbi:hypothetical protein ACGVWS_13275 [Enterobacteriaceae bacterium LUAb1]